MTDPGTLRQQLRAERQTLGDDEQSFLSQQAVEQLARHRVFRAARHIACYLPNDGELDISPLIDQAWAMGKTVYLPVLSPVHHNYLQRQMFTMGSFSCQAAKLKIAKERSICYSNPNLNIPNSVYTLGGIHYRLWRR